MTITRYTGSVITNFLDTLEHAHAELGDLFFMPLGKTDLLMVCSDSLAYEVLVTQKDKFTKLGAEGQKPGLQRVLGNGLLTNSEFESWFSHRQIMQPFFQKKQLELFFASVLAACHRLLEAWRQSSEPLDLTQAMHDLTLELMFEFVFSLSATEAKQHPIVVPLNLAIARNKLIKETSAHLDALIYPLIEARRQAMREGKSFDDLLNLLLLAKDATSGEGLSNLDLRNELLTVFAAGHETTANALVWAFVALSNHKDALAKLRAELNTMNPLDLNAVKQASYLQAVFKESLRLYPAIPFAPRVAKEDTLLGNQKVLKGTRVFVSIYSIQRNAALWHDAGKFKPERFLESPKPTAYMPFGLGERVCIGQHLASLEIQLILAMLCKHSDIDVLEMQTIIPRVTISLQTKQAVMARVRVTPSIN